MSIDVTGQCLCGKVKFAAKGDPMMSCLCHCRACSRAVGMSPVHLLGVGTDSFSYTEGADDVEVVQGMGKMEHVYCKSCHGMVEQHPKGAGFVALLPATFRCETPDSSNPCGVSCKLPAELVPNIHINYENRHYDWNDDLPKFVGFPGSAKLKNDGTPA